MPLPLKKHKQKGTCKGYLLAIPKQTKFQKQTKYRKPYTVPSVDHFYDNCQKGRHTEDICKGLLVITILMNKLLRLNSIMCQLICHQKGHLYIINHCSFQARGIYVDTNTLLCSQLLMPQILPLRHLASYGLHTGTVTNWCQ